MEMSQPARTSDFLRDLLRILFIHRSYEETYNARCTRCPRIVDREILEVQGLRKLCPRRARSFVVHSVQANFQARDRSRIYRYETE